MSDLSGPYRPKKETARERLVSELAAIQTVQGENLPFHGPSDRLRLAQAFAQKSAELVALEIAAYRRKLKK